MAILKQAEGGNTHGARRNTGAPVNNFRTISSIKVDDASTWREAVFLTIDVDWAHEEILQYTIDLLRGADISSTWFVTHESAVLSNLRGDNRFELGIHPNFNFLLEGDSRNGRNVNEVIERIMAVVPDATSVRSHSMTQSTVLLQRLRDAGLTHDANQFVPAQSGIELRPWTLWNGMIRVPYLWEDDVHCMYGDALQLSDLMRMGGLKVFDFHPIHVFLNTESLDRYERTRPYHQYPEELIKHRYLGYGTCSRLLELIGMAK